MDGFMESSSKRPKGEKSKILKAGHGPASSDPQLRYVFLVKID
jgi:hypothetical protein